MAELKASEIVHADRKPTIKLYKYFGNIDHAIDAINSEEIYLPFASDFNDPFDSGFSNDERFLETMIAPIEFIVSKINSILLRNHKFITQYLRNIDFDVMRSEYLKEYSGSESSDAKDYIEYIYKFIEYKGTLKEFIEELKMTFLEIEPLIQQGVKVCCFSEVNNSILMWSYYGDNHRGVCLEYHPLELDLTNEDNLLIFNGLKKVNYSKTQYNQREYFTKVEDIENIYFNKAIEWCHEQEWRLVLRTNKTKIKFPCLTGIYLGVNFRKSADAEEYAKGMKGIEDWLDNSYETKFTRVIQRACKFDNNKIGVYEAKIHRTKYELYFDEIIPRDKTLK